MGALTVVKNLITVQTQNNAGAVNDTIFYDLEVFNKLAMDLRTPAARMVKDKFNDILVQVETTGSYGLQIDKHDLLLLNISKAKTDTERAIAISELEQYHEDDKRALRADNENLTQVLTDTSEKLITAIRTKAQIGSKREATAMSTAANLSKKNKKLENDLTIANDNINTLTIANNQLQEQLDDVYSSLYRDKRVAEIIKGKYEFITYKFNTLKPRVNKALKAIALVLNEPIKEKPNPMNDTYAPMLYFTKRVVDQLLDNIEKDHNYLKRFSK